MRESVATNDWAAQYAVKQRYDQTMAQMAQRIADLEGQVQWLRTQWVRWEGYMDAERKIG